MERTWKSEVDHGSYCGDSKWARFRMGWNCQINAKILRPSSLDALLSPAYGYLQQRPLSKEILNHQDGSHAYSTDKS